MMMHSEQGLLNVRVETLAFIWPDGQPAPRHKPIQPYTIQAGVDRDSFETVQSGIGWLVTDEQWSLLSSELLKGSMIFVKHGAEPVAVGCALHRDNSWVELAWVAVVPEHRGIGIGKMLCSAVVRQVFSLGNYQLYGSTQDSRLAALKIYLNMGFHPVYSVEKVERWRLVSAALEKPFAPKLWNWPSTVDAKTLYS